MTWVKGRPRRCSRRRGLSDERLLATIQGDLAASPFLGEGYRKVWARLRVAGLRTSRRRVLRLMREHGLLAPQRQGAARGPRAQDGTITPAAPDLMWGADLTSAESPRWRYRALAPPGEGIRRAPPGRRKPRCFPFRLADVHGSQGKWPSTQKRPLVLVGCVFRPVPRRRLWNGTARPGTV
jgi:transposase InsO family protein